MIELLSDEEVKEFTEVLKILSNPARLKLLNLLSRGEFTVSELCEETNLKQSLVSQQLKNLRLNNIVDRRKEAPRVYYKLKEERIIKFMKCIKKCGK
ncbi:MAG: metalloregulator ArsR/SmtB family transcription factor [Candidatus Krumholzibacteriota bacterium]|nr:metalloregulator ArsR/SmtB family transcription factor [Candidatus Krumholzibacteriota bacterium]